MQSTKADCPAGTATVGGTASSASVCECAEGYTGTIVWADSDWVVDCIPIPCPSFASRADNSSDCYCDVGYVRDDDVDAALAFADGAYTNTCREVPCPMHATRLTDGSCDCAIGYAGTITFNAGSFQGQCISQACPANSSMANGSSVAGFGCVCDYGFTGAAWDDVADDWEACELIACPANSKRAPDDNPSWMCQCAPGYTGSISWNPVSYTFDGTCTEASTDPQYAAIPDSALSGAVCTSMDGVTDSTAVYTSGGISFDFVKDTILRCDINVGSVDFSKVKGTFTVVDDQGVDANSSPVTVSQNKMLVEWYNVHKTV